MKTSLIEILGDNEAYPDWVILCDKTSNVAQTFVGKLIARDIPFEHHGHFGSKKFPESSFTISKEDLTETELKRLVERSESEHLAKNRS